MHISCSFHSDPETYPRVQHNIQFHVLRSSANLHVVVYFYHSEYGIFMPQKSIERKYNRMHIPVFPEHNLLFGPIWMEGWWEFSRLLIVSFFPCRWPTPALQLESISVRCTFLCSWLEYSIACNLLYPGKHLSWNTSRTCDIHLLAGELGRKLNTRKLSIVKLRSSRLPRILVLVFKYL